jgi:methyl-accepting chemotaxis protein
MEGILKTFWELCAAKGGDFHIVQGKLQIGQYIVNGNYELPDKIKGIFGGTATVFMGDTRVSTNVEQADGSRAIGTKLLGAAYDAVIKEGKPYRGEAIILNIPYFTAYDPIKNKQGEVIGVLYVGVKKADYLSTYDHIQSSAAIMAVVIAAIFSLITLFLVRKSLTPIIAVVSGMSGKIVFQAAAIAKTMQEQSGVSSQLSSSVVEISSTMEEFSSTASLIANHSQGVVTRADQTLNDSKVGTSEVENLNRKINDISQNIQTNVSEIVELGKTSKEVNKIKEIINNIAYQTKLIAFNAALEAASAGEMGKRFGVVATEIRTLADNVVESTSEIEVKVANILDSVSRLVMSSEKSFQMIQEGQEYADRTLSLMLQNVDGVDETANAARQISLSTQQQQIASSQVFLALKNIEQGIRQSTDSISQTSTATDEMLRRAEQLQKSVMTLVGKVGQADSQRARAFV